MLFATTYRPRPNGTEETEKRGLNLFVNWTPPKGFEFKAHYALANGGGIAIVEADSSLAIIEAIAPWNPYLEFDVEPCAEISEAVPITQRAYAWRDSVR